MTNVANVSGPALGRDGLSLVELLVAILVLTVGMLGLAAGTSWSIRAIELAELDTKRAAALQAGVEQVRAIPFAALASGSVTEGEFDVSWTVVSSNGNSAQLRFVIEGPGRVRGSVGPQPQITATATDTLNYRISRP
jgi:prepilin-type N-terminal cleavage/methylation domain-containing protein